VSRCHGRFERDARGWIVVDLGSRNGTCVDGERRERRRPFGGESVAAGGVRIAVARPGGRARL
jgi:pSer/pThr/pTyr-binding forkhead associated (FHA) protein